MNIIYKILFSGIFLGILYFAIELIKETAFGYLLPELPTIVRCFIINSGLDIAIDIFLQIIIYGFIIKQLISYIRSF